MDQEEWRPIPNHPGYEASSHGRIRRSKTGKLLHQQEVQCKHNSYLKTSLGRHLNKKGNIRSLNRWVHRLICTTFHGPNPIDKKQVRHLDGNTKNNRPENLAWGNQVMNEWDKHKRPCVCCGRPYEDFNKDGQPMTPGIDCSGYKTKKEA